MPLASMGMSGISKSQVSRLCEEIDGLSALPTSLMWTVP
jgi:hypothetical protein